MQDLAPGRAQPAGAGPFGPARPDMVEPSVRSRRPDRLRRQLDRVAVIVLALAQRRFGAPGLGHIAVEHRHAVAGRVGADLEPDVAKVGEIAIGHLIRDALRHHPLQQRPDRPRSGFRPELQERATLDLLAASPVDPQTLGVDPPDAELPVEQENALAHALEHALCIGLALPHPSLGDPLSRGLECGVQDADNPPALVPDRTEAEAEDGFLAAAATFEDEPRVLDQAALAGEGRDGEWPDGLPDLRPDLPEGPAERFRLVTQDGSVGIVVDRREVGAAQDRRRETGLERRADNRAHRLRPGPARPKRGRRPAERTDPRSRLAAPRSEQGAWQRSLAVVQGSTRTPIPFSDLLVSFVLRHHHSVHHGILSQSPTGSMSPHGPSREGWLHLGGPPPSCMPGCYFAA